MRLESLVIANQHVAVNDLSNFAHTAHHARRVGLAGHYLGFSTALGRSNIYHSLGVGCFYYYLGPRSPTFYKLGRRRELVRVKDGVAI